MKNGTLTTIESVVILYGSISFCVFQTGGVFLPKPSPQPPVSTAALAGIAAFGASNFELEDVKPTPTPSVKRELDDDGEGSTVVKRQRRKKLGSGPSIGGTGAFPSTALPLSISTSQPLHYTPNLNDHASTTSGALSPTVASASAILGSFSSTSSQHEQFDYNRGPPTSQSVSAYHLQQQHHLHTSQPGYQPHPLQQAWGDAPSQQYSPHGSTMVQQPPQSYSSADFVASGSKLPPLRPAAHSSESASPDESAATTPTKASRIKMDGVLKTGSKACESCGTINSPEWRKGPGGVKSLCNACGPSFPRSLRACTHPFTLGRPSLRPFRRSPNENRQWRHGAEPRAGQKGQADARRRLGRREAGPRRQPKRVYRLAPALALARAVLHEPPLAATAFAVSLRLQAASFHRATTPLLELPAPDVPSDFAAAADVQPGELLDRTVPGQLLVRARVLVVRLHERERRRAVR